MIDSLDVKNVHVENRTCASVALKTFYSIQNVTNWHLVRNKSDIVTISNPIQWVTVSPYTPEALGIILSTITCFQMFFS